MRKWEIVAHLYHDGLTYEQTAERLGISVGTVSRHVEQIAWQIPGDQPPAWKVLRTAARLLELGYGNGDGPHYMPPDPRSMGGHPSGRAPPGLDPCLQACSSVPTPDEGSDDEESRKKWGPRLTRALAPGMPP
jgi:hypothetical protein